MDNTRQSNPNEPPQATQAPPIARMAPARNGWWVFLLGVASSGLYYSFWMVARAREIKVLQQDKTRPAWWFFVPLIALAQIIALPKFEKRLGNIERDFELSEARFQGLIPFAIAGIVICSIAGNYSYKQDWLSIIDLAIGVLFALCFSVFQARTNSIAVQLSDRVECHPIPGWQRAIEILSLMLLVPLWVFVIYVDYQEESQVLEKLGSEYQFEDSELGVKMDLSGEQWRRVEVGSYSDGSAKHEFANDKRSASILIFFQPGSDNSLDSLTDFRFDEAAELRSDKVECRENRDFEPVSQSVRSVLTCESSSLGDTYFDIQGSIDLGENLVEVVATVEGNSRTAKKTAINVINSIKTLRGIE